VPRRERRRRGAGLKANSEETLRATKTSLGEAFAAVRPRLELVEQFIDRQLAGGPPTVQEAGRYVVEGGGKRLRPALLLVVSRMLGYAGDRDIAYGAVVEMIHTATLVHDDIIDHADVRRGRATANDRWGNQLTVLLGDWLYIRSMEIALELGDLAALRLLSRATVEMVEGEILGLELQRRVDITRAQYDDLIRRKTAELFSAACALPALFAPHLEHHRGPLARYGRSLGTCFQVVDDILDVTASQSRLGKPVFSDLREGKLTLPFILLLPLLRREQREAVAAVLAAGEFTAVSAAELRAWLDEHGIVEACRAVAAEHGRSAVAALAGLPPSPERDALAVAPGYIVDREY
jgi:octaprenyl-diphosphate synthase